MLKKIKTIPVLLRIVAALCAVAAFCMMFADQISFVVTSILGGGETTVSIFGDADADLKPVTGAIVGYIIILVGALIPVITALFIDNKTVDLIGVALGVIAVVVGVVLVFNVVELFKTANNVSDGSFGSLASATYKVLAAPIVAGILGIVAAAADAVSLVFPTAKAKKKKKK